MVGDETMMAFMSSAGETPFDSLHLRYERVREQLADEIERERRAAG